MNVIITGGSGMIGRRLTTRLLQEGNRVWILSRNPEMARIPEGAAVFAWDARTPEGWSDLVEEADVILNLAGANIGERPWTNERKALIRNSRLDAGQAVVEAVRLAKHKPRLVVQASAVGYYGTSEIQTFEESSPPGRDYLAGVAVDWENSTRAVEDMGVRRVILRTGLLLARDEGVLPRTALPVRLFAGGSLGNGRQWYSWIHWKDEIDAILFLIQHPEASGAFNLTAPAPCTNAEFMLALARVLQKPYWLPTPGFALKIVLGEMSDLVLKGQKVIPTRLPALGFRFQFNDLESALREIYS